jgi:glycosidase
MQWSPGPNAGFTASNVKPWMSVNPNHVTINAENEVVDPNSVFSYWRTLLNLRKKEKDMFVYGNFEMVDRDNQEIFAYTRHYGKQQALVVCNWTEKAVVWEPAAHGMGKVKEVLLNSYGVREKYIDEKWTLRPYEAVVLLIEP